jgi:hypothetical protein
VIPGNSVQDANPARRSEPDDASRSGATAGYDGADHGSADHGSADHGSAEQLMSKAARSPRTHRPENPLQDIQHIIDELAAVTKKLRRPGDRLRDRLD